MQHLTICLSFPSFIVGEFVAASLFPTLLPYPLTPFYELTGGDGFGRGEGRGVWTCLPPQKALTFDLAASTSPLSSLPPSHMHVSLYDLFETDLLSTLCILLSWKKRKEGRRHGGRAWAGHHCW